MASASDSSYEIHTGRELELMLRGAKPLAHFYDEYPAEPCEEIIPEEAFSPYVASGVFESREFVQLLAEPPQATHAHVKGIRHVFFVLPAEAWRIDAYIDMQLRRAPAGWSLELERLQGRLLGYEDWQTDIHLERLRARSSAQKLPWLFNDLDERVESVTPNHSTERMSNRLRRSVTAHVKR